MLKMGLLWFDDNPKRPLAEKLDEAVERYQERFDVRPTLAHVNPSQAAGLKYKRLQVHEDESLRRNYFIVGVDEADIASGALLSSSLVRAPARPARKAAAEPVALEPVALAATAGSAVSVEEKPAPRRARKARAVTSVSSVMNRRARSSRRAS